MTSQINYSSIDINFPRSGIDNNAQGFRNNFSSTQNALIIAKQEITDLQAPLVKVMSDENNDGAIDIYLDESQYQTYNLIANTNFSAGINSGLPGHLYQGIVQITNTTSSSWSLTFTGTTYIKLDGVTYLNINNTMILPSHGIFMAEVWTIDAGATIFLKVLGVV